MSRLKGLLVVCLSLVIVGCVTSPQVIIQKAYPERPVEEVRLLVEEPKEAYETLAVLTFSAKNNQSGTDEAIEKMKVSAAGVGADALVVGGPGTKATSVVGVPMATGGTVMIPLVLNTISAKAVRFLVGAATEPRGGNKQPSIERAVGVDSLNSELEKLDKLFKGGLISEAEYIEWRKLAFIKSMAR